ncbi:MAG: hypothetical protein P1V20_05695 [Verrucomicrobiales bacterium]|nr:hypothetical protein [Verrucomicrobiales bacterium]
MIRLKLFGFPIQIHKFFWLLCLTIGFSRFISGDTELIMIPVLVVIVFITMLWHELGHAFARRKYGVDSKIVLGDLSTIGGAVSGFCAGEANFTKRQVVKVAMTGPLYNLIIVALVFPLKYTPLLEYPHAEPMWELVWLSNLAWAIFNIAPVLPLDGGQIYRVARIGRGPLIVPLVGLLLSILIAILGAITGRYFATVLFGIFIYQNWMIIRKKQYLTY